MRRRLRAGWTHLRHAGRRLIRENWYRDVWLLIITGLAVWSVTLTYSNATETHESLCTLRADLERRVETSKGFLRDHPNGTPGIPAKLLVKSVGDQQRTIAALRRLDCPE